jgi:DNA-binding transcriptional LysR family regulator
MCRVFQEQLRKRGLDWYPSLELTSLDLVARYVAEGYGVGLSVVMPSVSPPANVRIIALEDFPAIPFGALWMGKLNPLAECFLQEAEKLARELYAAPKKETKARIQS